MNVFELILSPFIFIIKQLFLFGYHLTGNYGWAIILLSFFISLLLLPVFIYIEKAKKKTDAVKRKMQPLVDEIKRCYKGQERYYYLKTLNRQHGYSPLKAMIPILSLLLQIPFFIAAYQYLEHFEALQGVSFGFIKDLSQPDAIFGAINILPIAMTVVNLITAWFYTRNGNTGERKQMLVVALAFLILLYKLPAGLVLYWTMNNVFSFFRLFVTNPEVFKKSAVQNTESKKELSEFKQQIILLLPKYKKVAIVISLLFAFAQINWAFYHDFDTILIRLLGAVIVGAVFTFFSLLIDVFIKRYSEKILNIHVKPIIYYSLLFLAVYFYFASKFYFGGVNTEFAIVSALFLLPLQLIATIYFINYKQKTNILFLYPVVFVLIMLLFLQGINFFTMARGAGFNISFLNITIQTGGCKPTDFLITGILYVLVLLPFYHKKEKNTFELHFNNIWGTYLLSILFITGLIFLWHPLIVYSSSPQTFGFLAVRIVKNNLSLFINAFFILVAVFLIVPKKVKQLLAFTALFIVIISFINSSILPLKLGSLQQNRFSEQEKLAAPLIKYILDAAFLIVVFYFIKKILQKNRLKYLVIGLIVLNIIFITNAFYSNITKGVYFEKNTENKFENKLTKGIPFSKTEKNIVYFIADGVQGWFIKQITEENPELKKTFSGFTWYPNTISMANYTHASVPSLLSGYSYSIENMNKDKEHSIEDKWQTSAQTFIKTAITDGYFVSADYQHYFAKTDTLINTIPLWDKSWENLNTNIRINQKQEIWYSRLIENAMFFSAPLVFKPAIYNNNKWLIKRKSKISSYILKWYNFMRLLPYISKADSHKPNFIYFHNEAAHNPWHIVKENGRVIDATPYENNKWIIIKLAKWIKWMKDNGVYDNTKIIIVSDHGPSWYESDFNPDFKSPVNWNQNKIKIDPKMFWRLNPLLMVKEFGAKGELKENWKLMCNTDAAYITFSSNYVDSLPESRILHSCFTLWEGKIEEHKTMKIEKEFVIKNNIFDLNNWEIVKSKQY